MARVHIARINPHTEGPISTKLDEHDDALDALEAVDVTLTGYALLAGRAGGQTLKGDTASGGALTLMSTAHATKGTVVMGTTTFNEATGRWGFGTAPEAFWNAVFGGLAATDGIKLSNTGRSYVEVHGGAGGRMQVNCFNAGDTRLGQTIATGFVSLECHAGETMLIGPDHSASVNLITNNVSRLLISGAGVMTHWDGETQVHGSTTGTKIGTATGQKLGWWGATPVVQQVLATGAAATVDNVITVLQTLGLCKQS